MTANPHRGEVEITLAGKSFLMRPSFGALAEIEAKTGDGIVAMTERVIAGKPKFTDLAAVVWAGLRATGEPASYEKVGELVVEAGLEAVVPPVVEFLGYACSGGRSPGEAQAAEAG